MDSLVGRKIVAVRELTKKEMKQEYWFDEGCVALVLDDGTILYPSRDPEGNGAGALFGRTNEGKEFQLCITEEQRKPNLNYPPRNVHA